jgi:putative tricarboxylic transport membrane protein
VIGLDPVQSTSRFTYGTLYLQTELDLVPIVMGLFGIAEVFNMIEKGESPKPKMALLNGLAVLPGREDWRKAAWPTAQGTITGFIVGLLPGAGATISSYVAYALAKRWSRTPERYGSGEIGGVAAPEAANNSATASGFIPLLTLGLPANVVMALMLGAFLIHGITPGPTMMFNHPEMFWGIITSMFVGNVMLVVIMLPLIGLLSKVSLIPEKLLAPFILLICVAGAYGLNNNPIDIAVMMFFGVLGYLMGKFGYPPAPLILAFVLGPIMETSLRQSLIMSQADFTVFVTRPLSATLIGIAVLMIALPLIRKIWS